MEEGLEKKVNHKKRTRHKRERRYIVEGLKG
jgi:hypothetical protein